MKNQKLKYLAMDFLSAMLVWICFFIFRRTFNDLRFATDVPFFVPSYNLWLSATFYPFLAIFIHYLSGFYNANRSFSRVTEFLTTFISAFFITLITYFVLLIDDVVVSYTFYYKSFLVLLTFQFVFTYIGRFYLTQQYYNRIKKGLIKSYTLIIGTGTLAQKTTMEFNKKIRKYGNSIVGYVTLGHSTSQCEGPILGDIAQVGNIIKNYNIHNVIIAIDKVSDDELFKLINDLIIYNVTIQFPPSQFEILTGKIRIKDIDASPFVTISEVSMPAWQQSFKRVFDIFFSVIALILFLPFLAYIAVRIKKESKGDVFYRQERIGKNGRPFNVLKLRTMYEDAERNVPLLSSPDDERITPFGRFLRKYRIDEIPQFWNVLKGEMSIVGPRPERLYFIRQIMERAPYYCLLYKIQPGLLSWGPIKVGYSDSIDKMIERLNYDIIYMDNMTLLNDLKIIIYSLEVIFKGKGI